MLAVVCPVKTRAMPSWTPLSKITASTWPVMLISSLFALDLTLMALVKTFIYPPWERKSALLCLCAVLYFISGLKFHRNNQPTSRGAISPALPLKLTSATSDSGVASGLISTTSAPPSFALTASDAAGWTTPEGPMTSIRSVEDAASNALYNISSGSGSPNQTTPGLKSPPQQRLGSIFIGTTLFSLEFPHSTHWTRQMEPW